MPEGLGGLGRSEVTNPGQGDKGSIGEHGLGPRGDLEGHFGVSLTPQKVHRRRDVRQFGRITLGQDLHKGGPHGPGGRPVVRRSMLLAKLFHPPVTDKSEGVEFAGQAEPGGRLFPATFAVKQGNAGQHQSPHAVRSQSGQSDGNPSAKGVPDHREALGHYSGLADQFEQGPGVLLTPPPGIRRWRGAESRQVECDNRHRTGREGRGKILMTPPPTMESQHFGRSGGSPGRPEEGTVGKGLQHRPTLPIASAFVASFRPSDPTEADRALAGLTGAQRQAVESDAATLRVLAGAGSGKTRVLTLRVAHRIHHGTADADHTAVCTFTRKAAIELRQRLSTYGVEVSRPGRPDQPPGPGVRTGTLHQLALAILRRHARDIGQAPPEILENRFMLLRSLLDDAARASALEQEIGWAKARGLSPAGYPAAARLHGRSTGSGAAGIVEGFAAYEEALGRRRVLDLDDVLLRSTALIDGDPSVAEQVRWRYRYLFVDEFQDINPAQFSFIQAVLGREPDLCVVGDPNQAIYGWNGADPTLLDRLGDHFPALATVRLDDNHRCTPQVVAAANAVLGERQGPLPRSAGQDGPRATLTEFADGTTESEDVTTQILNASDEGAPWSTMAVLARTNEQLRVLSMALKRAGVPHRMAPGPESPPEEVEGGDVVELATFHRAKGLEWESVWIIGLEDGFVPISHAKDALSLAEERRLLYVALTRAGTNLHCSWARERTMSNGRSMDRQPSPWLANVARVAKMRRGRTGRTSTAERFAGLRASLSPQPDRSR